MTVERIIVESKIVQSKKHTDIPAAMRKLTGNGFRLYSYLWNMAELENGHSILQLFCNDVCEYTGMCQRSFYLAVEDLTKHNYLKQKPGKRLYYLFNGRGD